MDPYSPIALGAWIHYGTQHPGAIMFLMFDFFLFFGVLMLTLAQISQVYILIVESY